MEEVEIILEEENSEETEIILEEENSIPVKDAKDINYKDNTGQGVTDVQAAIDEAFNFIENLNESFDDIDAKNMPYEDEYGYGTPDNVQDALNFAFEELDDKMSYVDATNSYVHYNANQTLTNTQKQKARNNIGIPQSCIMYSQVQTIGEGNKQIARQNIGALGITDLGEIDLDEYQGDVNRYIDTLIDEGIYRFIDNSDYFTWIVEVYWLGEYQLGQKYCYSEEGYTSQNYRNGYYDEDSDTVSWDEWTSFITLASASLMYAPKNHSHFLIINTSQDIRTYLDNYSTYSVKDLRVISATNKHIYMVRVDYNNYTLNGVTKNLRYQEYYDIEEPNKIYKRKGLASSSSTASIIDWEDWCVFEDSTSIKNYINTEFSTVLDNINGEVV